MGDLLSAGIRRYLPTELVAHSLGRLCFVAGTLVERGARSPSGEPTFAAIESIQLGQRVNDDAPAEAAPVRQSELGEPDAATWRKVVLRAVNAADADVEIELLRPAAWLAAQGAAVRGVIQVDLPELNTRGPARVLAMEPSPAIELGAGTVVTGRFRHLAENLLDVYVEGLNEPIGCTERHPFWSVTRGAWVAAADLRAGERLLGSGGATAQVASLHFREPAEPVFNLEVLGPHVYRVSPLGLLVHNASFNDADAAALFPNSKRIDYGKGLSAIAANRRSTGGARDSANLAVVEYVKDGVTKTRLFKSGKFKGASYHSEEIAAMWLSKMGVDGKSVTRLYSEFHPCATKCDELVRLAFPIASIEFSFPYRHFGSEISAIGRELKGEAIRRIRGA